LNLVKTSFFSALITAVRISSGFLIGKFISIVTGPSGVAIVGAFTNFISIVSTLGNGAINNGVIKYTAQYQNDLLIQKGLFSTSFKISIFASLFVGLVVLVFSKTFSLFIFNNYDNVNSIRVFSITLFFFSMNTLIVSVLNGQGEIKKLTIVNAISSFSSLILTIILVFYFNIKGALYSLVVSQVFVFLFSVIYLRKNILFSLDILRLKFDIKFLKNLSHFSLMSIVTALTVPVSQIILRNMISDNFGINFAGYWQGMMKISDGYLLVITTSLSTYYLPKLSSLETTSDLRREIFSGYKIILPIVLLGCIIIYYSKYFIINLLYTSDFLNMDSLFFWQLSGDFFKISSWILSYLMLAKARTKLYVSTEIIFSFTYVVFGYYFTQIFGFKGISMSFALNYFLYLILMIVVFNKLLFSKLRNE
jgi:O-antigen/teichoic acid export membrane protein